MSESSLEVRTYFPVALAMIEINSIVPCELWLKHSGEKEPVLYRSGNLPFTREHKGRLLASGVETVLIPFDHANLWTTYLERRLRERINDPGVPLADRAEVLINTSKAIMKDVLADPRAPETKERVGNLADSICDLMRVPSALETTVRLMEHDYYTYTHCLHVAIYSIALARQAGIDDEQVLSSCGRGGLMHDCGKCKLPASLINKPGRFSESEWELMKKHPDYGMEVLGQTSWSDPLVEMIVHSHHERLDGSGYPQGLAGRSVPEAARITAIADAFDAMTTDRAYQRARRGIQAMKIIHVDEKNRYDSRLTEIFIKMMLAR